MIITCTHYNSNFCRIFFFLQNVEECKRIIWSFLSLLWKETVRNIWSFAKRQEQPRWLGAIPYWWFTTHTSQKAGSPFDFHTKSWFRVSSKPLPLSTWPRRLVAHKSITSDTANPRYVRRTNPEYTSTGKLLPYISCGQGESVFNTIWIFNEGSRIFIHQGFVRLSRIIKFFWPSRGWLLTVRGFVWAELCHPAPARSCQIESDSLFLLPEELFIGPQSNGI